MQSRMEEVRMNRLPKFLAEDMYEKTHAIIVNDPLNPNEPMMMPLTFKGSQFIYHLGIQRQVNMRMNRSHTFI